MKTEYVDLTPTWEQSATSLACCIAQGMTPEGERKAIAMIAELGKMIDHAQEKHPGILAEFERVHV